MTLSDQLSTHYLANKRWDWQKVLASGYFFNYSLRNEWQPEGRIKNQESRIKNQLQLVKRLTGDRQLLLTSLKKTKHGYKFENNPLKRYLAVIPC